MSMSPCVQEESDEESDDTAPPGQCLQEAFDESALVSDAQQDSQLPTGSEPAYAPSPSARERSESASSGSSDQSEQMIGSMVCQASQEPPFQTSPSTTTIPDLSVQYSIHEQVSVLRSDGSWSTGRINEICDSKVVISLNDGSVKNIPSQQVCRVLKKVVASQKKPRPQCLDLAKVEVSQPKPLQLRQHIASGAVASLCASRQVYETVGGLMTPRVQEAVCNHVLEALTPRSRKGSSSHVMLAPGASLADESGSRLFKCLRGFPKFHGELTN